MDSFYNLSIALKIGWGIFSAGGITKFGNLEIFYSIRKGIFVCSGIFGSFTLSLSSLIILLSSASVIFSFDFDLSESNGLTVLQNCLLSAMSLWFRLA